LNKHLMNAHHPSNLDDWFFWAEVSSDWAKKKKKKTNFSLGQAQKIFFLKFVGSLKLIWAVVHRVVKCTCLWVNGKQELNT
jgi:hypothetical protein